uniref:Uncharacterized protein n=1 Tax=Oryza glumipatula TaxID=40148 RepID=A0A0E0BV46_9ORYZ
MLRGCSSSPHRSYSSFLFRRNISAADPQIAGEEIARLEARGVGVSAGCEAGGGGSTDIRARAWAGDRLSWAATGPKQDTILFVAEISEQDVALRKVYLGSLNYVLQSAKDNVCHNGTKAKAKALAGSWKPWMVDHMKVQLTSMKARQCGASSSLRTFHATACSYDACRPMLDLQTPPGR